MVRKVSALGLMAIVLVIAGCGGGGDGGGGDDGGDDGGVFVPTPTPTKTAKEDATIFEITAVDNQFVPRIIELTVDVPYSFRLTNEDDVGHKFRVNVAGWGLAGGILEVFAGPMDSTDSPVFVPRAEDMGTEHDCYDPGFTRRDMKCTVVVIEAGG